MEIKTEGEREKKTKWMSERNRHGGKDWRRGEKKKK